MVALALGQPELSPRELAVRFTDEEEYFVSEGEEDHETVRGTASPTNVYRLPRRLTT